MEVVIKPTAEQASLLAARVIASRVRADPQTVLGLATGGTPRLVYRELIRLHREEALDFSAVTTFNLDEYLGLAADHPASYRAFMQAELFDHINITPNRIHIPDGMTNDVRHFCRDYEQAIRRAGGIEIQLLGIGRDGHIGFNEHGSSLASRTRIKTLTRQTLEDNRRFFGPGETVPEHVITLGVGTIMEARQCLLLALGGAKAEAVAAAVEGPVTASVPASALQWHPDTIVLVDEEAAGRLERADYYRWTYDHKPAWQRYE